MTQAYEVAKIRESLLAKMGEHAARYPSAVENFSPRILARIADLWGTSGLDAYLDALMLPERQERQGFPMAVASELLALARAHDALGLGPKASGTGWAVVEERARDDAALADKK